MALLANTRYLLSAIQDLSRYFAEENKPRDWHAIVRARLETRESRFLRQVKEQICDVSWSPYRNLLTMAGCEFGDLEGMVRRQGLEETLRELFRSGVYLSFEEFRGRSDVVRGASRFRFRFEDFDNPRGRKLLQERTGGSRSVGLPVAMSLENVDERAPATYLALEALEALDKVSVIWLPGPRISYWLRAARLGIEEILPREFGGGSVDYQLLEAEDEHHLTRLFLLVSPRLGDVDEEAVRRRFIAALETSGGREGMPDVWRRAVTIQVLRREPVRTKSDKLFPFHTIALSSLEAH